MWTIESHSPFSGSVTNTDPVLIDRLRNIVIEVGDKLKETEEESGQTQHMQSLAPWMV